MDFSPKIKNHSMIIREMLDEDCESLAALTIHVWLHTYATRGIRPKMSQFVLSEFSTERFQEMFRSSTSRVLLAIMEEHLIGLIVADTASHFRGLAEYGFEIQTLYVHPFFQRQGVGRNLLLELHKTCGPVSWLKTWVENTQAIGFYTQCGYREVGRAEFDLLGEKFENYVFSNYEHLSISQNFSM